MFAGRYQVLMVLACLAFLLLPSVADACPTCKDALAENDPAQQQMVKGYFYSILFMMSMPFAILVTFGSMAYLSVRRARAAEEQSELVGDQDLPGE